MQAHSEKNGWMVNGKKWQLSMAVECRDLTVLFSFSSQPVLGINVHSNTTQLMLSTLKYVQVLRSLKAAVRGVL